MKITNSGMIMLMLFSYIFDTELRAQKNELNYQEINNMAVEETLLPISPGTPGIKPFWNTYSKQFIYAPAFDFKKSDKAVKYKFYLKCSDKKEYSFVAEKPWNNLSPVWKQIPTGFVDLRIEGYNSEGKNVGITGTRKFYKASPFTGPYHQKEKEYGESAKKALECMFNFSFFQKWKSCASPDTTYDLYCYPSKIIGAVIGSMTAYSKLSEQNASDALTIAKNAAKYLIKISEPEGTPLEYFPPTYKGIAYTSKKYKDQYMIIYPAEAAMHYLDLFDITKDSTYYKAAVNIAGTYSRLQLPSGTWKLKLWQNGKAVNENDCIPVDIIEFFDRLSNQYKLNNYRKISERAFKWIMDNPVKTFNWSGQFEDVAPGEPYKDLTEHNACSFAMYLFNRTGENPQYRKIAEELIRFSEDQFVVWEKPMPQENSDVNEWITPGVLEQYDYYVPIDASASKMISGYLTAYRVTNNKLYLAKAVELANTMTTVQSKETGQYPTYWWKSMLRDNGWINCAYLDVKAMMEIAEFTDNQ